MGRRSGGARRAAGRARHPLPATRRGGAPIAGLVLLTLVVTALATGAGLVARSTPAGHHEAARATHGAAPGASPSSSPGDSPPPQPVVRGVRFTERILTVPEMRRRFARLGLVPTGADPTQETTFTVASFNVLGSSHTARRGAAAGPARAARAGALVRRSGVEVVGLQELQAGQVGPFLAAAGMVAYPGTTGSALDGENSVAWDPHRWQLLEARTAPIPYFGGKARNMPQVLLRHLSTRRTAWFTNYHNPADVHGAAQGFRVAATAREAALARELGADGTAVLTTGDMNERDAYACRYSAAAGMHSADGARTVGGSCRLPGDEWIDWIWGSGSVAFGDYRRDFGPRAAPRISDHPLVTATATIEPAAPRCRSYDRHGRRYWFCPAGLL